MVSINIFLTSDTTLVYENIFPSDTATGHTIK